GERRSLAAVSALRAGLGRRPARAGGAAGRLLVARAARGLGRERRPPPRSSAARRSRADRRRGGGADPDGGAPAPGGGPRARRAAASRRSGRGGRIAPAQGGEPRTD